MVGIPLMNLGTALGGLTQGFQNYQTNQIQNAIRQLALSQAQRQNQAATLAGLGLSAGLLNQQPMQPISPISAPGPQPPPPGQPSQPNDPGPGGHGTPTPAGLATYPPLPTPDQLTAPPLLNPNYQGPRGNFLGAAGSDTPQDTPPSSGGAVMAPGLFNLNDALAAMNPEATQQQPAPAQAPTPQPAPGDPQPPAPASQQQQQPPPANTLFISPEQVRDLFSTVDTNKLAQGLARIAPPGTDPATIYEATADLLKLANGNKEQAQQATAVLRAMGYNVQMRGQDIRAATAAAGQAAATQRTGMQQAGAEQRAELGASTRLQIANINAAVRAQVAQNNLDFKYFHEQRVDSRFQQRMVQTATRLYQAAIQGAASDLGKQVSDIRAQIMTIKPDAAGTYSPQQEAQLKRLAGQLEQYNKALGHAAEAAAQSAPEPSAPAPAPASP